MKIIIVASKFNEKLMNGLIENTKSSLIDSGIEKKVAFINSDKNKNIDGGKAFTEGGYGCVFRPALKCKTEKERS